MTHHSHDRNKFTSEQEKMKVAKEEPRHGKREQSSAKWDNKAPHASKKEENAQRKPMDDQSTSKNKFNEDDQLE